MINKKRAPWIRAAAIAGLLLAPPVFAEEAGEEEKEKNNSIGLFVGLTSEDRRDKGLALGIEGTHFFTESFGIGGVIEYTFGDIETLVGVVPLVYRTGKWKFYAGPGFEDGDASNDAEFLVRAGTEYGFEVGSFEIAPQFNVDFVDGDAVIVVGVLFARPF
jgi:hypothetical protein